METKYGIISDVEHPYLLREAVARFKKERVDAILSLGNRKSSLKNVDYTFQVLGVSQLPAYFYGLSKEANKLLEEFRFHLFGNVHPANNLGQKIANGNHEIVFFSDEDLARAKAVGIEKVMPSLQYPGRTIAASYECLREDLTEDSVRALEKLGVRKLISASGRGIFQTGYDFKGQVVSQRQEGGSLIWDAGSLRRRRCGILSVYKNGNVSYETVNLNRLSPVLFRKSGVDYVKKLDRKPHSL